MTWYVRKVAAWLCIGLCASCIPSTGGAPARVQALDAQNVAPGVTYTRTVDDRGPWVIHVVRIDLRRSDLALSHARARDSIAGRERVSEMARRREAAGATVLVAINADFFDVASGASENNVLIGGEWWRGAKVTDSPFDTFDNAHSQFALDSSRRPYLDRFVFSGRALTRRDTLPILALNARPAASIEGVTLFSPRFGGAAPRDSGRMAAEVELRVAGQRGDTIVYVRRGPARASTGSPIPRDGAVLAGYGDRARAVAALADGDTVRAVLELSPSIGGLRPSLLVGGWPRILRDGRNVARASASDEGTISRNAEARHPRSAVGFSRDSATLFLAVVDGRSTGSVGMTLTELADAMRALGVWDALNFDGGGSTTLVVRGRVVNTPADASGERAVGSALLLETPSSPRRSSSPRRRGPRQSFPRMRESSRAETDLDPRFRGD